MSGSLLPKASSEFGSKSYWQNFFSKRKEVFEWYGDYGSLCGVLHRYCCKNDKLLVPGCGNSNLSEDLYDAGFKSIINIDISPSVIKSMSTRNEKRRPVMKYLVQDAKNMEFENEEFNVVLDKGTLDALFTAANDESVVNGVRQYLSECVRVLSINGCFICVSLAQQHIIEEILEYFGTDFTIRIHCLEQDLTSSGDLGSKLPVFVFVLTKIVLPLTSPQYEISMHDIDVLERSENKEELLKHIKDLQNYAMVQNHLAKSKLDEILSVELWSEGSKNVKEPRYTLTVVENPSKNAKNGSYAIFIVPQGRENEWIFSSEDGQKDLCECAGFKRLSIATLHRGHTYESIDQIKVELSLKVMELAPPNLPQNTKVPFLTATEDVGYRVVQYEGCTQVTGDIVIEDIQKQDQTYARQMIFRSTRHFVQSEARLVNDPSKNQKKKKKKQRIVDTTYLMWDIYKSMIAGLVFLPQFNVQQTENNLDVLLIGVGGGCLPSFISKTFSQIRMTCVELDKEILSIAKTWFCLQDSSLIEYIVDDGLVFLQKQIDKGLQNVYDVIIFDVGASVCGRAQVPPLPFVEDTTLKNTKTLLKKPGALFVNTTSLHENKEILTNIKRHFSNVYLCELEKQSNRPLICLHGDTKEQNILSTEEVTKKANSIQKFAISKHNGKLNSNNFDISSFIELMKKV